MTTDTNAKIIAAARTMLGVKEVAGALHNPAILEMFEASKNGWVTDDETPWCAAFVGFVLSLVGIQGTNKLNARSYLDWGHIVPVADAQIGDVVVKRRGDPNGPYGHVFFFTRREGGQIWGIGGNQSDAVTERAFPVAEILGVRRATDPSVAAPKPHHIIARMGDRGEVVAHWQKTLASLNYKLGAVDGIFGNLTRDAVMAFQADNAIPVTGAIDELTVETIISRPTYRPASWERQKTTKEDLLAKGSKTMRDALFGKLTAFFGSGGVSIGLILQQWPEIMAIANEAQGMFATLQATLGKTWPVALVLIVGIVLWRNFNAIEDHRVKDAQTIANVGR